MSLLRVCSFRHGSTKVQLPLTVLERLSIDGVLLRSSKPIPGASDSLAFLQNQGIPFILLTNGGGKHEVERVADLSNKLNVPLDTSVIVQSHTPFAELVHAPNVELKDKCVLVVGGDGGNCQKVAEKYVSPAFS